MRVPKKKFEFWILELNTGLMLKGRLLQGLPALEQQFLQEPTYLRAGSAEFITFRDTAIGSGEQTGYFWFDHLVN